MPATEGRRPQPANAATTTVPIQSGQFTAADLADPNLSFLNTWKTSIENAVNSLQGAAGPTKLPAGVDVAGARVTGINPVAQHPTDAVSKQHAEDNYSARALAPQLEAGSNLGLKTYRALNSNAQQENYSGFLQGTLNVAPTANSSVLTSSAPSGGSVSVTISAGSHLYVSGDSVSYAQRTDTLQLPSVLNIASISRSGGMVTATLSASQTAVGPGDTISVTGVTDPSFDGGFVLLTASGITLTWTQIGANATSTGGSISANGVFYYFIGRNSQTLALAGPFGADTQQVRTQVNKDGTVLIATIVLNGSGMDLTQSAAGATPPVQTGNARILTRL